MHDQLIGPRRADRDCQPRRKVAMSGSVANLAYLVRIKTELTTLRRSGDQTLASCGLHIELRAECVICGVGERSQQESIPRMKVLCQWIEGGKLVIFLHWLLAVIPAHTRLNRQI